MKKSKLFILPILAMSIGALSSCTKDDINSLFELGNSLEAVDNNLQSQIDDLKQEVAGLKTQITSLKQEMNDAETALRSEYNQKINKINEDISTLEQEIVDLTTAFNNDKQTIQNDYNTKIDNLRTYIDGKISELNNTISEDEQKLTALENKHDADKTELQNDYTSQLAGLSSALEERIASAQNDYNQKIADLETRHDSDKQDLFDDYTSKLEALSESSAEARQALKEDYESKLAELESKHDSDKSSIQSDYNQKLAALEETFTNDKQELQNDYNTKITALNNTYSEAVNNLQTQITTNKNAVDDFKTQYTNEKAALENDYNTKISNLRTTYETNVAEIETSIQTNESAIEALETELSNQVIALQNDYNAKINALTSRVATLEEKTYHTVTFDTGEGGSVIAPQQVLHGEKISQPARPTRPGYSFCDWTYMDEPWMFLGYVVTEDMVIKARWDKIAYSAIFLNEDGTILERQSPLFYGDSVTYHGNIPIKPDPQDHYIYTFAGWDADLSYITGNVVATAKYSAEYTPYTAYFLDDNGEVIYRTGVREGETATYAGELPTKEDNEAWQLQYQFSRWDEVERTSDTITYKAHFEECTMGLLFQDHKVYQYIGSSTTVLIPSYWDGENITSISERAFEGTRANFVEISEGIEVIEENAFNNCTSLSNVSIPSTVTSIESRAFSNCSMLRSLLISEGVTSIGMYAFSNCTSLNSFTFPNSVTTISESAFSGCSSLYSVRFSNSLTYLGDEAFAYCNKLASINLPNSLTNIGDGAFYNCTDLSSITFPSNIQKIGCYSFSGCSNLTRITIPNTVTEICDSAFANCTNLEAIYIPSSVTNIGMYAFMDCPNLSIYCESEYKPKDWSTDWNIDENTVYWGTDHIHQFDGLYFQEGITSINGNSVIHQKCIHCDLYRKLGTLEENKSLISNIIIPDTVLVIDDNAFKDCSLLEDLVIPNSVISIGNYAFQSCSSLKTVTFPNSLTSIGNYAFQNCRSLTSITIPSNVVSVGACAFGETSLTTAFFKSHIPPTIGGSLFSTTWNRSSFVIYVPVGSGDAYRAITAKKWQDYAVSHIQEYDCVSIYPEDGHFKLPIGETLQLTSNLTGVTWAAENPEIATINSDGLVTGVARGRASFLALKDGYETGRVSLKVTSNEDEISFDIDDLTEESKNHLVFEDGGARFWGRPIGNAVVLDGNGYPDPDEHEPIFDKNETGDYFELIFNLTTEQAIEMQNCRLYCDAKPAQWMMSNNLDFFAAKTGDEEWTPGLYIDDNPYTLTNDVGTTITGYRYALYVDDQFQPFEDSITNPITSNDRTEFVVPFTFHLHEGTNKIRLHMAGGYKSLFYGFTFRSVE